MNIQQEIQRALQYYNAGNYQQAQKVCKKILKEQPDNAEVLYFLGVIYSHLGDHERAVDFITQSLALYPNNPDGYHLIAMSYEALGRLDEAEDYYRKTVQYNPNYPEAYNNLANVLKERMRITEAIENYEKAIALKPYSPMFHFNLGVAQQEEKDYDRAIRSYRNALLYDPQNTKTLQMLGSVFEQKGQLHGTRESFEEAEKIFRSMVQASPSDYCSYTNLGKVLQHQGKYAEAVECYRKALELNPHFDEAHFSMGDVLHETGSSDEAILHYQKAIEVNPGFTDAHNNLGVILSEKNRLDEAMESFENVLRLDSSSSKNARAFSNLGNILSDLGRAGEAEQRYRQALAADPSLSKVYSNLLLSMNYNPRYDAAMVFSEHLSYATRFGEPLYPYADSYVNEKHAGRRLRIGYLSPDFRSHSVAYFIEPVIAAHDRRLYEVFCYADVERPDEVTTRIMNLSVQWRDVARLTDEQITEQIRFDQIDILIDLAGHTAKNRMLVFARKPAPVQMSWIGYPSTTGLRTVDYKIVDRYTDPPGMTEQYFTEHLVRLPDSFLCYLPEKDAPEVQPLPALKNGYITFGSFNNLAKISEDILITWVNILKALPTSRLCIKAKGLSSSRTRTDMASFFQRNGIAENRIQLLPPALTTPQHLAIYNEIDIALDTFPYNGATTTCEALWMGVPVVTLTGSTHASLVGASLLTNIGLPDLIAHTADEYIQIAKTLSDNVERLSSLRKELRGMVAASPVTDAMRFTGHLEKAYRDIWIQWCGESTGDAIEHEADRNSAEAESIHDRQTIFPLPIESCKIYREKTDVLKDCSFIICSMLTPGERYYRNADRLADSCEKYSLPYRISEMPAVHTSISLQGTEDLAYTKANFIASSMEQFPGKNILYLDADLLFVDYPARIREISDAQYDFAVYNWLSDKHNEAYIPFVNRESHEPHDSQCYIYSHHVEYYCTDQLVCSGGVQFWRNSPGVRRFLEQWQNMIALTPSTVDDRCLDYAYNNLDTVEFPLRVAWLDKPYLRMPWWPHVKPVILHLGMPNAELRCPTEINGRKHFYPEWCEKKGEPLYFPAGYIIDAKKKLLAKVENSGIVTTQPIQNEFWIYPEEK